MKNLKVLIFDIETAPNLALSFGGKWKVNLAKVLRHPYILCFSYQWLDSKKISNVAQTDFKTYYKKNPHCDKKVVEKLHKLMDEADIVMAHNGDSFDIKQANTRFLKHGLVPYSDIQTIDPKKICKKVFGFVSNSLKDIAEFLGVAEKLPNEGIEMWIGCMNGTKAHWKNMIKYNNQDVKVLRAIYEKIKNWIPRSPMMVERS